MDSKIKISFWLYKAKKNQKNLTPVYLRVRSNYSYFTRSTGLLVKSAEWDKKTMQVRGASNEAISINSQLQGIRHKIIQIINQLTIGGKPFDVEMVKKKLEGKEEHQMTMMKVYDEHLKVMMKLKGKEFTQSTIIKYANTRLRLSQYLKYQFKRNDFFLYELNHDFMKGFEVFLRDRFDNSTTTVYKHYQRFTRVLNIAIQKGYLDRNPFPTYKIRMPKKKIEYLVQTEIDRIESTDFKIERLNIIRDIFVFCIYSGLAYTEVEKLSKDDITVGADGEKWMNIQRKKTHKSYQVPILPNAMVIIERYKNNPQCIKKKRVLPVPSNTKFNCYLKEIGDITGIKTSLTTHIARKTFATTVMLGNGVNIGVLSRLLGHASVQVTLDSYGTYHDQLMLAHVGMVRKKLTDKSEDIEITELNNDEASNDLLENLRRIENKN